MIILTTTAAAQTLSVIPREYDNGEFAMSIRDDQTNVKVVYTSNTGVITGNYLQFSKAFFPVLVEGHFFDLHLYVDSDTWSTNNNFWNMYDVIWNLAADHIQNIFRDKIFCTDQTIDQSENDYYKLDEGQYVEYDGYVNNETLDEGVPETFIEYDGFNNTYDIPL
tara:strand:- start:6259 stop:6753 length:495 start_codon:yes stop_codon:yes gene_type:complete